MKTIVPRHAVTWMLLFLATATIPVHAQLFDNLRALGGMRFAVGDPSISLTNLNGEPVSGPKDIVVRDLDGDGPADFAVANKDGSVTVWYGDGDGQFDGVQHLLTWDTLPLDYGRVYFTNQVTKVYCDFQPTGEVVNCYPIVIPPSPTGTPAMTNIICVTNSEYGCVGTITNTESDITSVLGPFGLRGIEAADWTGDARPDLAVASPGESRLYVFTNLGSRVFSKAGVVPGWFGVRDLAAGDFDGDGRMDLAAAGSTNGLAQFRSLGDGSLQHVANLTEMASDFLEEGETADERDYDFPQPAYYLKAIRHPGDDRDELIISFAQRRKLWILRAGLDGVLSVAGSLEDVALTSLDAGPLVRPATPDAPADLLTAYSRGGCMDIFEAADGPQRFAATPVQRLYVPGSPRNVRIVDLDLDGWNDIVVVAQAYGQALIYRNDEGTFTRVGQAVTGESPREMGTADFNGDNQPDVAVVNRNSHDVTIFLTSTNRDEDVPVGFLALDSVYPVDGGVSGLDVKDFNGDGRSDVLQLHRDSAEFSVRLAGTNGTLGDPMYVALTNAFQPAAQILVDVNRDGYPDMVSANLSGSVTVWLGSPDGMFGAPRTFVLPPTAEGSLFALVPGDFDNDGFIDLAAGYLDCRVTFFRGDGDGGFTYVDTHLFLYEPRSMATADLDQDGDLDLVGGSWMDRFVVVENDGRLLEPGIDLTRVEYGSNQKSGALLKLVDQNNDGDPDVLLGRTGGFGLWVGGPGLTFTEAPVDNEGDDPDILSATFVLADLDGDGDLDRAVVCATNTCLTIQVYTNSQYITVLTVPVPFTQYLGAGDLDGDGFADLVGTGEVLWVALSSRPAEQGTGAGLLAGRGTGGIVINEVLPQNVDLPLASDGNRTVDWVELYNDSPDPIALGGWQLQLIKPDTLTVMLTNQVGTITFLTETNLPILVTNVFTFPQDSPLPPGSHLLLVCADSLRTPYHTGFKLPAEGALLCLINELEVEVDRVAYPAPGQDRSYARYSDGAQAFAVNNFPSPNAPNVDNGAVEPELELIGVDVDTLRTSGQLLRFRARASDDVGIVNVSVLWRRMDLPDAETKRAILYDDGLFEDGGLNDGEFAGTLDQALPPGAEIQFYLECTDISDTTITKPGNPRFATQDQPPNMNTLAVGIPPPPLELSELMADNATGIRDEQGGTADWVEIRNTSGGQVSLEGLSLGPRLFGNSDRIALDAGSALAPGEHRIIFTDGNPDQGLWHAPFRLALEGESLWLTGTTLNGARYLIDQITYPQQATDVAYSRLGAGGPWATEPGTPRAQNISGSWRMLARDGIIYLAYPTQAGRTYTVHVRDDLTAGSNWIPLPPRPGIGLEQAIALPLLPRQFFRVVEE